MMKFVDFWCFWLGNWVVGEIKRGEVLGWCWYFKTILGFGNLKGVL